MKQPKIITEWNEYKARTMPQNVSKIQLQETRRAFYAGAVAVLSICQEISAYDWTEEEGAIALENLMQECVSFASQVGTKY